VTADRKFLGAFTGLGMSLPPYVNFSQEGDEVVLTARQHVDDGGRELTMRFPAVLFGLMLEDFNKNFVRYK
jgi:hypothetical protein